MSYQKREALQTFRNICTATTLQGKIAIGRTKLQEEKRDHGVEEGILKMRNPNPLRRTLIESKHSMAGIENSGTRVLYFEFKMPCQLPRLLLEVSDDTIIVHGESDVDIASPPFFIGAVSTLVMGFIIPIWKKKFSPYFEVHELALLH